MSKRAKFFSEIDILFEVHLLLSAFRTKYINIHFPVKKHRYIIIYFVGEHSQGKKKMREWKVSAAESIYPIDIKSLQNRLLKVCYVPATSARLPRVRFFFFFLFLLLQPLTVLIKQTRQAVHAVKQSVFLYVYDLPRGFSTTFCPSVCISFAFSAWVLLEPETNSTFLHLAEYLWCLC